MANKNILVNVDFHNNQILNVLAQVLAADPGTPSAGQFWFRSDLKQLSFYDGTTVQRCAELSTPLNTFAVPTASVSMGGFTITNLGTPVNTTDAATKTYVDSAIAGLDVKASSMYATTAALPANTYANGTSGVGATLTGTANGALAAIDGQTPAANDRILVKNEATAANNGIYTVTQVGVSGTSPYILTRTTDFNTATPNVPGTIQTGAYTFVERGTSQAGNGYIMTTAGAITVGTTALTWTQFTASASFTAGAGIEIKSGSIIALPAFKQPVTVVAVANLTISGPGATIDGISMTAGQRVLCTAQTTTSQNGIWVWNGAAAAMTRPTDYASGDTAQAFYDVMVYIDSGTTYGGTQWRCTTTGAITIDTTATAWAQYVDNVSSGNVSGVLPVANGGTGAATAAAARTSLGAVGKYAVNVGDGSSTSITVTHNLGTQDVLVNLYSLTSPYDQYEPEVQIATTNTVILVFAVAPASAAYRCVVIG